MTPVDWIFGSLLLAAIIGLAKSHSSNIRLENDKKLLTQQIDELTRKIADLTEENTQAIKRLTDRDEADIKHKDSEIAVFHRNIEFRRGPKTNGKWAAFCPKCHLPAIDAIRRAGRVRIALCSGRCGWEVFKDMTLDEMITEIENDRAV
jgi:hypothetical protein